MSVWCVKCNRHLLKSLETINDDKAVIPLEIVTNYLYTYFYQKQVYLTIVIMSSNAEQENFQEDFITKLMVAPKFGRFQYNFLNELDQLQRGNQNAFSLIFIDGITSLK